MAAPALSVPNPSAGRLADPALREALLKYARRRLPAGEVEDLVQNTLTDALISGSAPSSEGELRRWLLGIARHKIADSYRRRGRSPILVEDVDGEASPPAASPQELAQWIERELPKTDGAQATLHWLLRESDGESLDEIARDAALPAPRVRQRVSRLRRHFHTRWLALGAAGLVLLLGLGLLYRVERDSSGTPDIAHEPVRPLDHARALRQRALERCADRAYPECVAALDQAKALDPAGDAASAVQAARSAAAHATGSPEPSLTAPSNAPEKTTPKQAPPSKALPKKPSPKKPEPQLVPQKAEPNRLELDAPAQNVAPTKASKLAYPSKAQKFDPLENKAASKK